MLRSRRRSGNAGGAQRRAKSRLRGQALLDDGRHALQQPESADARRSPATTAAGTTSRSRLARPRCIACSTATTARIRRASRISRTHLCDFGVSADQIPTTFNVFMNVVYASADAEVPGKMSIDPPLSKAGDVIEIRGPDGPRRRPDLVRKRGDEPRRRRERAEADRLRGDLTTDAIVRAGVSSCRCHAGCAQ